MEIEINTFEQFTEETASGNVVVDFYATWCGPCRMLAPILKQVGEEHPELKILRVDVDQVGQAAGMYGIQSIPTLIRFKDGQVIDTRLGYMPKEVLERFLGF